MNEGEREREKESKRVSVQEAVLASEARTDTSETRRDAMDAPKDGAPPVPCPLFVRQSGRDRVEGA